MNYYAVCPFCGYKLLKAAEGSFIELLCPKCNEKVVIEIKDNKLSILRVLTNKTEKQIL